MLTGALRKSETLHEIRDSSQKTESALLRSFWDSYFKMADVTSLFGSISCVVRAYHMHKQVGKPDIGRRICLSYRRRQKTSIVEI